MKISIVTDGSEVSPRFNRSRHQTIFELDENKMQCRGYGRGYGRGSRRGPGRGYRCGFRRQRIRNTSNRTI